MFFLWKIHKALDCRISPGMQRACQGLIYELSAVVIGEGSHAEKTSFQTWQGDRTYLSVVPPAWFQHWPVPHTMIAILRPAPSILAIISPAEDFTTWQRFEMHHGGNCTGVHNGSAHDQSGNATLREADGLSVNSIHKNRNNCSDSYRYKSIIFSLNIVHSWLTMQFQSSKHFLSVFCGTQIVSP